MRGGGREWRATAAKTCDFRSVSVMKSSPASLQRLCGDENSAFLALRSGSWMLSQLLQNTAREKPVSRCLVLEEGCDNYRKLPKSTEN